MEEKKCGAWAITVKDKSPAANRRGAVDEEVKEAIRRDGYLPSGQIEQVLCDGENYGGARPCHYEWVKSLHDECTAYNITFAFCGTGRKFVKNGKLYNVVIPFDQPSERGPQPRPDDPAKPHRSSDG